MRVSEPPLSFSRYLWTNFILSKSLFSNGHGNFNLRFEGSKHGQEGYLGANIAMDSFCSSVLLLWYLRWHRFITNIVQGHWAARRQQGWRRRRRRWRRKRQKCRWSEKLKFEEKICKLTFFVTLLSLDSQHWTRSIKSKMSKKSCLKIMQRM